MRRLSIGIQSCPPYRRPVLTPLTNVMRSFLKRMREQSGDVGRGDDSEDQARAFHRTSIMLAAAKLTTNRSMYPMDLSRRQPESRARQFRFKRTALADQLSYAKPHDWNAPVTLVLTPKNHPDHNTIIILGPEQLPNLDTYHTHSVKSLAPPKFRKYADRKWAVDVDTPPEFA